MWACVSPPGPPPPRPAPPSPLRPPSDPLFPNPGKLLMFKARNTKSILSCPDNSTFIRRRINIDEIPKSTTQLTSILGAPQQLPPERPFLRRHLMGYTHEKYCSQRGRKKRCDTWPSGNQVSKRLGKRRAEHRLQRVQGSCRPAQSILAGALFGLKML